MIAISGDHHWSGAFTGDGPTAKIYEYMPNPIGNDPATGASSAVEMLWRHTIRHGVYGVFDVDASVSPATATVTFRGTGGAVLRTFVVEENGYHPALTAGKTRGRVIRSDHPTAGHTTPRGHRTHPGLVSARSHHRTSRAFRSCSRRYSRDRTDSRRSGNS
ncbi:MAG TPA: hypothetical protein VFX70_18685 [Mycobacteriales bacterium]|nr:hypothetical protein [Mycobacteriales bacterium]